MRRTIVWLSLALASMPGAVAAQSLAPARDQPRFFIEADLFAISGSAAADRTFVTYFVSAGEPASMLVSYPGPSRVSQYPRAFGGGVWLRPRVGFASTVSQARYADDVSLTANIPHPTYLSVPATDSGAAGFKLERRETSLNLSMIAVAGLTSRVQLRFTGGPSILVYRADMVDSVTYSQLAPSTSPSNVITVTGAEIRAVKATGLGFHAAADVTYFVTPALGISAGFHFSEGRVDIGSEPLSGVAQVLEAGSRQVVLRLRWRFGSHRVIEGGRP
jgi:hypothetical protein